jgi:hypothetical protein
MSIPIYYEVPLFIFVLLAIYTIYKLVIARRLLTGGSLNEPYLWFIIAAIFFLLWGVDHIYHDMVPLSENLRLFFHYVISHGMLLISMICIAIAAGKTTKIYSSILKPVKNKKSRNRLS